MRCDNGVLVSEFDGKRITAADTAATVTSVLERLQAPPHSLPDTHVCVVDRSPQGPGAVPLSKAAIESLRLCRAKSCSYKAALFWEAAACSFLSSVASTIPSQRSS
jgi:hypothetical protein